MFWAGRTRYLYFFGLVPVCFSVYGFIIIFTYSFIYLNDYFILSLSLMCHGCHGDNCSVYQTQTLSSINLLKCLPFIVKLNLNLIISCPWYIFFISSVMTL
jgi:hypothetical protein